MGNQVNYLIVNSTRFNMLDLEINFTSTNVQAYFPIIPIQGGYIIYSRAICGRSTPGRGGLKRPPYIDPKDINKGLYDSCVGGQDGSSFVIFDNSQVYPEYVLFYDASVIPLLQ